MSESTRVRLRVPESELVYVGEHEIAGRSASIKAWGVASPAEAAPDVTDKTGVG